MGAAENAIVYIVALATIFAVYQLILLLIRVWKTWRLNRDRQERDRQGNVFTIHDETNRETNRYNDIFFIEPNSVEAARIRAQLEKDEKDLPSYEEVMRMANLSSPTAAPAPAPAAATSGAMSVSASSSSVNTNETTLTVPEYTEVDLSATSGPVTPPPYSPPTTGAVINNPLHTQQISTSNV